MHPLPWPIVAHQKDTLAVPGSTLPYRSHRCGTSPVCNCTQLFRHKTRRVFCGLEQIATLADCRSGRRVLPTLAAEDRRHCDSRTGKASPTLDYTGVEDYEATGSSLNGIILQISKSSRVLYGLAHQRELPAILARVNAVTRTPLVATELTTAVELMLRLFA